MITVLHLHDSWRKTGALFYYVQVTRAFFQDKISAPLKKVAISSRASLGSALAVPIPLKRFYDGEKGPLNDL